MIKSTPSHKAINLSVTFNGIEYSGISDAEQSILESIEAMHLPIRSACRRGRCGSCKVQLASGTLHPNKQIIVNGYVLSCSSVLVSDAHVVICYAKVTEGATDEHY